MADAPRPLHFFISRAGEDQNWAKWISNVLEDAGHATELQDFDFKPGESIPRKIELALQVADHVILVLSPHSFAKDFTSTERFAAFFTDPVGKKRFFIPIRVAPFQGPVLFNQFGYIDFVGQAKDECRRRLLDGIREERLVERVAFPGTTTVMGAIRTSIRKLPETNPFVIGRAAQIERLEQAWSNPRTNIVQVIAPGGTGKTALMAKWYRTHLNNVTIFGWSFYSQGTREKSHASSDPFFDAALAEFNINVQPRDSVWYNVSRFIERLQQERVLLILDGIEPLQNTDGSLRDQPLKWLLKELAARNPGLVLCTTRLRLVDIADEEPYALSLDLEDLDPADGARYLDHLGVRGPGDEMQAASEAYGNNALALTLLGTYLVTFCDSEVHRRADIRELQVEDIKPGRHARKVMNSYALMYEGEPELQILNALGYFDRPAEEAALKLVLSEMPELRYRAALKRLRDARLILISDYGEPLDCHPLVREYFASTATAQGHARLYEYYKQIAPKQPDTVEEMTPLLYAVYHGCQAGRHLECRGEVYRDRIQRGAEFYLWKKLAAFGTDLSLLANFFETLWTKPAAVFSPDDQSWMINNVGIDLRAVGRIFDAVAPTSAGAALAADLRNWTNAAIYHGNLSELYVLLGRLPEAISAAKQAVRFAETAQDEAQRMASRTTLADALHQSGDLVGAGRLYVDAEEIQARRKPATPMLSSVWGFRYCDLLLEQGRNEEVLHRAAQTLPWEQGRLLDIGLDHLSPGRAHPVGSFERTQQMDIAVDCLRCAGYLDYLARALLARCTPRDLDEASRIASRAGMRLYLADYHLTSTQLALSERDRGSARYHFEKAETLVWESQYHRRDSELERLRLLL